MRDERRDATIAALRRQVEELERKRDYIETRRQHWQNEACKENARANAAEAHIADLERRLADAERGGMEKAAEIADDEARALAADADRHEKRSVISMASINTADRIAYKICAAIPAPREGKPE